MRYPSVPEIRGVEVVGRLHRGGMGDVFLARLDRPPGFGRWVALKVIRPDLRSDRAIRTMFLDEARVLAALRHSAIAQVVDFGEVEGTAYLLLEYVAGISFAALRDEGPVPPPVAARMVAEVARGLHAAHEARDDDGRALDIVHRDISPQNVMLTFEGRVKLLDFGIATVADRQSVRTSTGVLKGKLAYVAPEQLVGLVADRRSDTYSLCVVLHELLSGRALFEAQESPLAAAHERRRPPRPSARARVPRGLDRIVMRGLSERREQRWPDARSLAEALEGYANGARGESLEGFAERSLSGAKASHERKIRAQLRVTEDEPSRDQVLDVASDLIEAEELAPRVEPPPVAVRSSGVWALLFVLFLSAGAILVAMRFLDVSSPGPVGLSPRDGGVAGRAPSDSGPTIVLVNSTPVMDAGPQGLSGRDEVVDAGLGAPTLEVGVPSNLGAPPDLGRTSPRPERSSTADADASAHRRGRWGRISVAAPPGSFVRIDGEAFGRTPLVRRRIRAGPHVVELFGSRDKAAKWQQELLVRDGEHLHLDDEGHLR